MVSPKNYDLEKEKNINNKRYYKQWNNTQNNTRVAVRERRNGDYEVAVAKGGRTKYLGRSYSNRSDANKRAVKWMRNNRNGL